MIAEDLPQATARATRDWKAQLIEASRKKLERWSRLERQQLRESMQLPQDLEFDALDFTAAVKEAKENEDDV